MAADPRFPGFDPDAPNEPGNIFGLPHTPDDAEILLLPVPYEATTSYGQGTSRGPDAIREASAQLDLYDRRYGEIWRAGIAMLPTPELPSPTPRAETAETDPAEIDAAGERVCEITKRFVSETIASGKIPGVIGGEHAIALGGILAAAQAGPLGIVQIDAHLDLREAYEGYTHSHASVMFNALERAWSVRRLVPIGIRDCCRGELEYARAQGERVQIHHDADLSGELERGTPWPALVRKMLTDLPDRVWISFDIDGLDPGLCPNTGTPVPGGLSFNHAASLLHQLAMSQRTIVGFDLVEVAPSPNDDSEWDANVGARILYQLCGCAALSRGLLHK